MVLPGLAELLAAQKHATKEQTYVQTQEEEVVVEDKTPWPSASQYFDIFSTPKSELKIPIYDLGLDPRGVPLHPEFIYSQPVSCMYFLKCSRLLGKGSFGFPRKKKTTGDATSTTTTSGKKPAESSKDFEWRKMSFVTGLPKKQPIVRYITATCYSRATDVSAKKKVFRMHAVMLADEVGTGEKGDYVLVHIRAGGSKRVGLRASLADAEAQQAPASPTATAEAERRSALEFWVVRRDRLVRCRQWLDIPLFTAAEDPNVDSARLALRNMILKSCTSRDEMAKYVMGLQEELAALQNQNQ
ncbi:hypothetical protein PInf_026823 [Phytophthora infestans]|nr:hypothetical protein PInf_026823 [Phytophthora infestans]